MPNKNLKQRTPGEEFWMWRKQQGLTLGAAAQRFGVGRNHIVDVEADRRAPPSRAWKKIKPNAHTLLKLARQRSGLALREVAAQVGVSHVTLLALERAGWHPLLVAFWRGLGWRW